MALFIFSILGWKHLFWANFVQKFKIVNLSWNMVFRVIRIRRIHWRGLLFLFLYRKHPFRGNLVEKIIIVSLSLNLAHRLIRIYRIQWWYSSFLSYNGNSLFEKRKLTKLDYRFCYRFCDYHWSRFFNFFELSASVDWFLTLT